MSHIPPKVARIEKKGSAIKKLFQNPVIIELKKNIPPIIKNMKVMEIIWLWVVVRSSLIGLGNFSGISKLLSTDEPLNCSAVPSGER